MLNLQEKGCHNINFVTPTHQIYAIVKSLTVAIEKGLNIPLVYNSGGYDSIDTLQIIDGIFDIYMPDFKYWHSETGMRLSGISDYPEIAKKAIREMYHQVGDLEIDESGIAHRGLIVRHLILPGRSEESEKIIDFVTKLSNGIYMNLMDQYRPEYKAHEFEEMNRTIDREEYLRLVRYAESMGARLA
jgi:putative pyruvate formate lyase activating enzyme